MTPKEKAIQLIDKFKIGDVVTEKLQIVNINIYSKLFALRAVDEMICALACARTKDDNLTDEEIDEKPETADLQKQLDKALNDENYELASKLRDLIEVYKKQK